MEKIKRNDGFFAFGIHRSFKEKKDSESVKQIKKERQVNTMFVKIISVGESLYECGSEEHTS